MPLTNFIPMAIPVGRSWDAAAMQAVAKERERQDIKWGPDRNHDGVGWLYILVEEVGEAAEAILRGSHCSPQGALLVSEMVDLGRRAKAMLEITVPVSREGPHDEIASGEFLEVQQVSAVAMAWLACIIRRRMHGN